MRLIASDFVTHHRPSKCELRVFLRHKGEKEGAGGGVFTVSLLLYIGGKNSDAS